MQVRESILRDVLRQLVWDEQRQTPMDRGNQRQPIGGAKGRCGDGICQPIEREKGVCPEDCK